MIIVKIYGGLGNQMFQYAAGRMLAFSTRTELALDLSWFEATTQKKVDTKRKYELGIFELNDSILAPPHNRIVRLFRKDNRTELKVFSEKHFHVDPEFFEVTDNSLIDGYWQSERYFIAIENVIRQVFTFPSLIGTNKEIARNISNTNAVSLHVRRGDYVTAVSASTFHGTTNLDYYRAAIKKMNENIADATYYVFSDDIAWCQENLDIPNAVFVTGNTGMESFNDMHLMSLCKHHIIANSSFSWWGAWLNASSSKIVFAPNNWFNDASLNTEDLIPKSWVRI